MGRGNRAAWGRPTSDNAIYFTLDIRPLAPAAADAEGQHATRKPNDSFRYADERGAMRTNGIRRPAARKSASDPSTDMPSTHGNATAAIRGRRAA